MLANIFLLGLPLVTAAAELHGHTHVNRHNAIAKRATAEVDLAKRAGSSRWSFYAPGLGACGKYNGANDFIVALNSQQFDVGGGYPGPQCFKTITMRYNGKSTQATIVDRCPGCGYNGLDLSPSLFQFFDSKDKGIIYGSWSYGGGGGGGGDDNDDEPAPPPKPTKKPKPTTTRKPTPKPTPTSEATTSRTSNTERRSSKKTSSSTSTATSSPTSSAKPSEPARQFFADMHQAVIDLGGIVAAAAKV